MIRARDDILWVLTASGETKVFDAARLVESIQRVAPPGTEQEFTEVSQAIADAVQQHIQDNVTPDRVTTSAIRGMVQALLQMLGYPEAAGQFGGASALTEIRLDRLAADAGQGGSFELGFYQRLDQALTRAGQGVTGLVRIRGLRNCVLQLRGARRWSRNCRRLAEEIMAHVWARAAILPRADDSVLQLAVLE